MVHIDGLGMDAVKQQIVVVIFLAGLAISFDSCVPFIAPRCDVTGLSIEKKSNGYLVTVKANKRIDDVEAFVSQSQWLIITIANASVDTEAIESVRPSGIFRKIITDSFGSSVQVSLQLSQTVEKVELVRAPDTDDFFVTVFTEPKK